MTDGAHNLDPRLIPEQGDDRPGDQPGAPCEPADALRFERRANERRQSVIDRRTAQRAALDEDLGSEPPVAGTARMRGVGRRLADSLRSAEEGELNKEQFLFVMAIDAFKRENQVGFPAWTDVLEVVRLLGYRKSQPSELQLRNAEDWTERADAPSNVRPKNFDKRRAA